MLKLIGIIFKLMSILLKNNNYIKKKRKSVVNNWYILSIKCLLCVRHFVLLVFYTRHFILFSKRSQIFEKTIEKFIIYVILCGLNKILI